MYCLGVSYRELLNGGNWQCVVCLLSQRHIDLEGIVLYYITHVH